MYLIHLIFHMFHHLKLLFSYIKYVCHTQGCKLPCISLRFFNMWFSVTLQKSSLRVFDFMQDRAQSCELLTRICDLNSDFAIWIKSRSPFRDQKYPTSPTYFFFLHRDQFTKIVIKMADSSKQRGLSACDFLVPPTKKRREDSCKTEKSFFVIIRIFCTWWESC